MTTQELIAHLVSFDELKRALAYILLFMLIESYLRKNGLYAPLKQTIEHTINAIRWGRGEYFLTRNLISIYPHITRNRTLPNYRRKYPLTRRYE